MKNTNRPVFESFLDFVSFSLNEENDPSGKNLIDEK